LYGTAQSGGYEGYGTVFRVLTNGLQAGLVVFKQTNGANPYAGVIQAADGNFYGTTLDGGTDSSGTIFKITTSPALKMFNLYSFTGGTDGNLPTAGLVQGTDGSLYGTTYEGGEYNDGAIFKITTNGLFTTLYSFTAGADGYGPWAGLEQGTDGNYYGTTEYGGTNGGGTVFRINPSGSLTTLHSFNDGSDGASPTGGLIQGADGNFYGTTSQGGTNGGGTVFKLTPNGNLKILHEFGAGDGAGPAAALLQGTDGNLYGTTEKGGLGGYGTAFAITTNGVLTTLVWFEWSNGAYPAAPLIQATDGSFYGTTFYGGKYNYGTIFRLNGPLPPTVVVQPANQTAYMSMNAIFNVVASGTPTLTYQWRLNGTNLSDGGNLTGSGTSSLGINNVSPANAGTYSVFITNQMGSITSTDAVLTVALPPIISQVNCNPDGSVTINLSTAPYVSSRILTTTNLVPPVVWLPLYTNVAGASGVWQFNDMDASNYPVRFYRSSTP
jgi:uncharacterized repeat protein (TIGR03803 family)